MGPFLSALFGVPGGAEALIVAACRADLRTLASSVRSSAICACAALGSSDRTSLHLVANLRRAFAKGAFPASLPGRT